jgi:hypothetical protein
LGTVTFLITILYNIILDDRESFPAGASALTDSANTVEYRTMIKCTVKLRNAVSDNLVPLSGCLLSKGLITVDNERELRYIHTLEADRAAKLVQMIQGKVQLDHQNYHKFVDILKEEDSRYYSDILTTLTKTLREGNYAWVNTFSTSKRNSYNSYNTRV